MDAYGLDRLSEYDLETLGTLLRKPEARRMEILRWVSSLNQQYNQRLRSPPKPDKNIFEEDWDTLILLDACRYDIFTEENQIEGDLSYRMSPASHSRDFMEAEFHGESHLDTVYVTGNPFASSLRPNIFHDIWHLYETDWSQEYNTLHPDDVVDRAVEAHIKYPNKRIILHMMQPHAPYIGPTSQNMDHQGQNAWMALFNPKSEVTHSKIKTMYRETLNIALNAVEDLLSKISGLVVISSDHGELFGERMSPIPIRGYEHLPGLIHPKLRKVPWLTIHNGDRRNISSEPSLAREQVSDATDQLEALGYR